MILILTEQINIQPRTEILKEKKLIGQRLNMSLSDNKTGELWGRFMPRRKEIKNSIDNDLYSLQIFNPRYFEQFDPRTIFTKYALIEVTTFEIIPDEMESFILEGGQYAVFSYKGSGADTAIFEYIFGSWLPASEYMLDNRPHFEILGDKYKNNAPDSEEEIWIPVKLK
jgi:AraC family transcriptional regulator